MLGDAGYAPDRWTWFFAAEAGAAAALTGLLFVAASINLSRILEFPQLAPRTAKALVTLLGILFASSVALVPGQSNGVMGAELAAIGVALWAATTLLLRAHSRGNPYMNGRQRVSYLLLTQLAALPVAVSGASLYLGRGGGLYWLAGAVLVAFAASVLDIWVLLIEIQR